MEANLLYILILIFFSFLRRAPLEDSSESDVSETSFDGTANSADRQNAFFTQGAETNIQIPNFTTRINIQINNPVCITINGKKFDIDRSAFYLASGRWLQLWNKYMEIESWNVLFFFLLVDIYMRQW